MRTTIIGIGACVLLAGCGVDSGPTPSNPTTIDQVPPECVAFFKKFAGCNKKAFDVLIGSYDPKDNSAAQCARREAETPEPPSCD